MIEYKPGKWGLGFIFRTYGSVFPKGLVFAIPNAGLAICLFFLWHWEESEDEEMKNDMDGVVSLWSGYTAVLGFLVVFRNNQAYGRLWEGAGLLNQVRGEWFNAASNLISFCTKNPEKRDEVKNFQEILVRLMSMLHSHALAQICDFVSSNTLEVISAEGFDEKSLVFVSSVDNSVEVVLQWVQQLIVDAQSEGIVTIAPPILSRAFQELSRGIVSLNNARKIKDLPFPFPYAQLITYMLIVHWLITPIVASQVIATWYWSALLCFLSTFSFWCLTYIALEMDQPFGEDPNDLPFRQKQKEFNRGLLTLLEPAAQSPPIFKRRSMEEGPKKIRLQQSQFFKNKGPKTSSSSHFTFRSETIDFDGTQTNRDSFRSNMSAVPERAISYGAGSSSISQSQSSWRAAQDPTQSSDADMLVQSSEPFHLCSVREGLGEQAGNGTAEASLVSESSIRSHGTDECMLTPSLAGPGGPETASLRSHCPNADDFHVPASDTDPPEFEIWLQRHSEIALQGKPSALALRNSAQMQETLMNSLVKRPLFQESRL